MSPPLRVSAFLAPVRDTPAHVALAEELGFDSVWVYDSPLLYADPFATLGAGFTGRFTLGLKPVTIARLRRELDDVRGLLAGEERMHVEGGRPIRDMPVPGADGHGDVPLYVSCRGPRAQALARASGDGAMTGILYPGGLALLREGIGSGLPLVVHAVGAVADPGEPLDSPRLREAVGPVVGVAFHAFAEQPWRLEGLPEELRGPAAGYIAAVERAYPPERRHQHLHRGHLVEVLLPEDRAVIGPETIARLSFTGTAEDLRRRAVALAADGVDELAVQPGGDVADGLRRLAAALIG